MDESGQSFSCTICTKRFTNKKSQARHISYCRKSIGRVRSRQRACRACTKAKARCDESHPCCSRCAARGIICEYAHASRPQPIGREIGATNTTFDLDASTVNLIDIDIAALDGVLKQNSGIVQVTSTDDSWSSDEITSQYAPPKTDIYSDMVLSNALRMFSPKSVGGYTGGAKSSLQRTFLLSTLRSYPRMMLRGRSPPFIHSLSIHSHSPFELPGDFQSMNKSVPGPLAVCDELLQMYTMRNEDNVLRIWGAIRMEQDRLLAEYSGYDYRDTLAALQAISMYFVLRVFEPNEQATNFDFPLVQTMLELAVHTTKLEKSLSRTNISAWENWVLNESSNRTLLFLFVIDLLFDYAPAALLFHHCNGREMLVKRLPSTRNLWQASSGTEWEREYEMQCMPRNYSDKKGCLTYSDLLDYGPRNDGSLDFWLSEIDDFGNLVMAAASL